MKVFQHIKAFLLTLLLLGMVCSNGFAQNIYLKTSTPEVNICSNTSTSITIEVRNLNSEGGNTFSDMVITTDLADGMLFEGELSTNAVLHTNHTPGIPVFSLANELAPGASETISFNVTVGCDLLAFIQENNAPGNNLVNHQTEVAYSVGNDERIYQEPDGSVSFNVKYAVLQLQVETEGKNQVLVRGDEALRSFRITNTGTGAIRREAIGIEISHDNAGLTLLELSGVEHTLETIDALTSMVYITDLGTIGNGDDFFDPGEEIVLEEKVKLSNCNNTDINTNYFVKWGCGEQICNLSSNNSKDGSNISILSGAPNLKAAEINSAAANFCGEAVERVFEYRNDSPVQDPLNDRSNKVNVLNITFSLLGYINYSDFKVLDKEGNFVPIIPSRESDISISFDETSFAAVTSGVAGLSDEDGDGTFADLMPGEKITVSANVAIQCEDIQNRNYKIIFYSRIYGQNSCGSSINGRTYAYERNSLNGKRITGPVDIIDGQTGNYSFFVNRSVNTIYIENNQGFHEEYCENTHSSKIEFPSLAYKVQRVLWEGSEEGITYTQDDDGVLYIEGGGLKGSYDVEVKLDCDAGGALPQSSFITWEMYKDCNDSKCCLEMVAQDQFEVFNHCSGNGNGDASCLRTTAFEVERTTFGYPEPEEGYYLELPEEKLTKSDDLRLNAAMPGDQFLAKASGVVSGTSVENAFVRIQYVSPTGNNIFDFISGYFEVINNEGEISEIPITVIPTPIVEDDGNVFYFFELENYSGPLLGGERVNLYANFSIVNDESLALGDNQIERFRAFHYSLNEEEDILGCESFGSLFNLVNVKYMLSSGTQTNRYNCFSAFSNYYQVYGQGASTQDPFPNEFRANTFLQSFKSEVPPGLALEENGFSIHIYTKNNGIYYNPGSPTSMDEQEGTKIYTWDNLPFLDPASNNDRITFYNSFSSVCFMENQAQETTIFSIEAVNYAYNNEVQETISGTRGFRNQKIQPILDVSANTIQDGYTDQVTWEVNLCNTNSHSYSYAQHTWLIFDAPENIYLNNASISGEPLEVLDFDPENPTRKMIKVGYLSSKSCKVLELTASYTNCKEDEVEDIPLFAGYGCGDYPEDPKEESCNNPVVVEGLLQLRYKNAAISPVVRHEEKKYNLCEAIPYEVEVLSSGQGDMDELYLLLNNPFSNGLPEGISLVPNSAQYQLPDINPDQWTTLPEAAILESGKIDGYGWNLSQEALNDNPFSRNQRIIVRFSVEAGCSQAPETNFDPGIPILINVQGTTNCHDILLRTFQSKIEINGFALAGQDLLPNVITDQICLQDEDPAVFFSVTNPGTNASISQDLVVKLPLTMQYNGIPEGAPQPSSINTLDDGSSMVTWTLQAGIAAGATVSGFGLLVTIPDETVSLVEMETRTMVYGEGTCVTTGSQCPLQATTGYSVGSVAIERDVCQKCAEATLSLIPECAGNATVFNASFTEDIEEATLLWEFGDGSTSADQNPHHIYATSGTYNVSLSITGPGDCEFRVEEEVYIETCFSCEECIPSFSPVPGQRYVLSAWVKEDNMPGAISYENAAVVLEFRGSEEVLSFRGKGQLIDGWQRVEEAFVLPAAASNIIVKLENQGSGDVFFDDIRLHPFNANMKSFVYDPVSLRLMAELDENNYATFYEYDEEGALIRIKKETERGIMTIQESRNHTIKQ